MFESCHPDHFHADVAQLVDSNRLLTGRSWVRSPPSVPIYVDRSSMVEPRIVIPSVASSNLVDQPFCNSASRKILMLSMEN